MLNKIYILAKEKRDYLIERIESFDRIAEGYGGYWVETEFNPQEANLGAEDGSYNYQKFQDSVFYTASAEVVYNGKDGKLQTSEHGIIDVLPPHRYVKNRIKLHMQMLELKGVYLLLSNPELNYLDLIMLDTSLIGSVVYPFTFRLDLDENERSDIVEGYVPRINAGIKENDEVKVVSHKLIDEICTKYKEKASDALFYLEYLEYLLTLSNLLKEYERKIIGIAKTSTSNLYFQSHIPDIAIFNQNSKEEGYSEPRPIPLTEQLRFLPTPELFKGIEFKLCYVRLDYNKPTLRVELPYSCDKSDLEKILGFVKSNAIEGYPFLLKKAHDDVIIRDKDIRNLIASLGVFKRKEREIL